MNSVSHLGYRRRGARAVVGALGATVAIGLVACSSGSGSQSGTPSGAASPTTSAPAKSDHPDEITGQISAENGSSWTVTTKDGTQYRVDITPQTQFGTQRAPGTPQQFPVGSTAHVSGPVNDHTITATRITVPRPHHSMSASPTPPAGAN